VAKGKGKGKDHAYNRTFIPIPRREDDDLDSNLSDQDEAMLDEYGDAMGFLSILDEKGIARYAAFDSYVKILITS